LAAGGCGESLQAGDLTQAEDLLWHAPIPSDEEPATEPRWEGSIAAHRGGSAVFVRDERQHSRLGGMKEPRENPEENCAPKVARKAQELRRWRGLRTRFCCRYGAANQATYSLLIRLYFTLMIVARLWLIPK